MENGHEVASRHRSRFKLDDVSKWAEWRAKILYRNTQLYTEQFYKKKNEKDITLFVIMRAAQNWTDGQLAESNGQLRKCWK